MHSKSFLFSRTVLNEDCLANFHPGVNNNDGLVFLGPVDNGQWTGPLFMAVGA